ncbi:MAG: hypothetical protein OHK0013_41200 [Sandaracinaceae bacterium]
MTHAEIDALLAPDGERPCVRLYRRHDGTTVTRDDCVPPAGRETREAPPSRSRSPRRTTCTGPVAYVAPAVVGGVRTVPVRIELDALPPGARPGLFGRASISLVDRGISLPSSAVLIRDGSRTVVYVEQTPGRFSPRDVQIGPSVDGRVYVASGVEPGERVVVDGALLIDGAADLLL